MIKLIFEDLILNVISAYAPQVGLSDDVKRRFWEDLEDMVRGVPSSEKLFIGGDLNGHVGTVTGGFERIHEGFGYGESVVTQQKLLVADFCFQVCVRRDRCMKITRTRWWKLKGDVSQVFKNRVIAEGSWNESEDANICGRRWRPTFGRWL
jgi:hypothetical protein